MQTGKQGPPQEKNLLTLPLGLGERSALLSLFSLKRRGLNAKDHRTSRAASPPPTPNASARRDSLNLLAVTRAVPRDSAPLGPARLRSAPLGPARLRPTGSVHVLGRARPTCSALVLCCSPTVEQIRIACLPRWALRSGSGSALFGPPRAVSRTAASTRSLAPFSSHLRRPLTPSHQSPTRPLWGSPSHTIRRVSPGFHRH